MRKVEALCKQLLDEWTSIAEEKKEESWTAVTNKFIERVPADFLATMAEQFVTGATAGVELLASEGSPNGGAAQAPPAPAPAPVPVGKARSNGLGSGVAPSRAQEVVVESHVEEEAEDDGDYGVAAEAEAEAEPEEVAPGGQVDEDAPEGGRFGEEMKTFLGDGKQTGMELVEVWNTFGFAAQDVPEAMLSLFEVAMLGHGGPSGTETAARAVVELAKGNQIKLKPVEEVLQTLSQKLESLVEGNESAWHLYSNVIMQLFPKTPSTQWGFLRTGWNWSTWWQMTTRVLGYADQFRAFDILTLVLQKIQEKSGAVIKQQQVWKEGGRAAKVRQEMCRWGEMDDAAIVETLQNYGVEI